MTIWNICKSLQSQYIKW